jgi:site-specific DNA recombinase
MSIAYGYIRVSTLDQVQGTSLESQRDDIMRYYDYRLKPKGVEWGGVFSDPAVSGSIKLKDRKAGAQMFERVAKGDHVLFSRMDRCFRSMSDSVECLGFWINWGVGVHLVKEGFEVSNDNPMGKYFAYLLAMFAEIERERIRCRVTEGKLKIAQEGYWIKPCPHGYRPVSWTIKPGQKKRWKLEPCPQQRNMMMLIYWMREVKCMSYDDIARYFRGDNDAGKPFARPVLSKNSHRILFKPWSEETFSHSVCMCVRYLRAWLKICAAEGRDPATGIRTSQGATHLPWVIMEPPATNPESAGKSPAVS